MIEMKQVKILGLKQATLELKTDLRWELSSGENEASAFHWALSLCKSCDAECCLRTLAGSSGRCTADRNWVLHGLVSCLGSPSLGEASGLGEGTVSAAEEINPRSQNPGKRMKKKESRELKVPGKS